MRRVTDRLYIGSLEDCAQHPEGMAVVHACKHPCHAGKCGAKLPPAHPEYLAHRDGSDLYLNMIDPPVPLFQLASFERFLEFAAEQYRAGRELLIHCNQGQSRAPSLALLFCAKVLGCIDSTSYDNAWDGFEELTGETYTPGKGIETWLREHWHRMPDQWIPFIEGAATEQVQANRPLTPEEQRLKELEQLTPEECEALVMTDPLLYFSGFVRIRDKAEKLTPEDGYNEPHIAQMKAVEAYLWLTMNDLPVRLILGPKARQVGFSTITCAMMIHHSMRYRVGGMVIADQYKRTELLWKMLQEMVETDRFRDSWGVRSVANADRIVFSYHDDQGTEREFEWLHDTAKDPKAGMSGTRSCLWFSEAGRYGKEGKVTDLQVISNASSSVPDVPGTMIVLESTAEGASGVFASRVRGAVTLEERMQGSIGNGWVKVFCAWHEVPDYKLPRVAQYEEYFQGSLDEEEQRGVQLFSWTPEQIAWRRNKIKGQFDGNLNLFKQEYPSTEDEAFQSSGTPKFNIEGLARLEKMAKTGHDFAELGVLEKQKNGRIMFLKAEETPWFWMLEGPMHGARYLVTGDYMTGEQSEGSDERDEHAICVWRAPYKDQGGTVHNMKLVAVCWTPEIACQWDEDIAAERTHLTSELYGNCIIVPEVNQAFGVLNELKNRGANIWKRTKEDEASGVVGQKKEIPGWMTTPKTKPIAIKDLGQLIREQEIDIHFAPMVHQLRVFVQNANGSCSARSGEHDDWVMSAAIASTTIDSATLYSIPVAPEPSSRAPAPPSGFRGTAALG